MDEIKSNYETYNLTIGDLVRITNLPGPKISRYINGANRRAFGKNYKYYSILKENIHYQIRGKTKYFNDLSIALILKSHTDVTFYKNLQKECRSQDQAKSEKEAEKWK